MQVCKKRASSIGVALEITEVTSVAQLQTETRGNRVQLFHAQLDVEYIYTFWGSDSYTGLLPLKTVSVSKSGLSQS